MQLRQNFTAIGKRMTARFLATGGVAPYTYAVLPDSTAGGSIDVNGVYTPSTYGRATIRATDSLNVTATAIVRVMPVLQLVCDIIQTEMSLPNGHVYIFDQKYKIPTNSELYISVGEVTPQPYANINKMDHGGAGLKEVQSINVRSSLMIDIMSRNDSALLRKNEILMAFKSNYAQQQMMANGFQISILSDTFNNLQELEGAAIPFRYNITVGLMYTDVKEKEVSYYDEFESEIITNQ